MKALRMIACMLSVLLFSTSLFAADPAITLEYWVEQESPKVEEYVKSSIVRFEAENPGHQSEFNRDPYAQYRDKLLVAIEGAPYRMCFLSIKSESVFAAADAIISLDDYIAEYKIKAEDYYPGVYQRSGTARSGVFPRSG